MLTLFHGDKGGVGKSFVASTYIDAVLKNGGKESLIVVESDTRNPDVGSLFAGLLDVQQIDLAAHNGWMDLINVLADNPGREIVVSLPAGIGAALQVESDYLSDVLADLKHELKVFWTINRLKYSVILLREFLQTSLAKNAAEIVVVKNGFFGDDHKFVRWNDSNVRKEFLKLKAAREIYLPELHERVVDEITKPWSVALDDASLGLKYATKAELQRWLKDAHKALLNGG